MGAETKRVTLDIARRGEAKKLTKLISEGWAVVSEHKRGILEWKPGQVDYVLMRTK